MSGPVLPAADATAPTVSVLVKAYNHAPYVRQTIDSVLAQSFQDFEIVVTDDASTDGTLEVLRGFTDPRIRLEALPRNLGISGAMNATIARARGRYLAILNSDDWALPDRLRRQVAFLDANPGVSLVFGLPRPVDEAGEPATAFNDFARPLTFPDFSRRSWLRQFFFDGNCLCAPTAMIRREAYAAAGGYDPRLTNLQDLDMWIRMVIAGHDIHVLAEELTAFRIRDNQANMSAPRQDTLLRSAFEMTRILKRFCDLDADQFENAFGADAGGTCKDAPVALRVAELARTGPRIEHQIFALECFYEAARDTDDFHRLRVLAGSMDPLRIGAIAQRERWVAELHQGVQARDLTVADLTDELANTRAALAERDLTVADLADELAYTRAALAERDETVRRQEAEQAELMRQRAALLASPSWRLATMLSRTAHRHPGLAGFAWRMLKPLWNVVRWLQRRLPQRSSQG